MKISTNESRLYEQVSAEQLTTILVELRSLGFTILDVEVMGDGTFTFRAKVASEVTA